MSLTPHNPTVALWGGPLDGLKFEGDEAHRFLEPPVWHRGYRRHIITWHADRSVCGVRYVWREVWEE